MRTPITDAQHGDAAQFQWPIRYDRMHELAKALERENQILRRGFSAIGKKIVDDCILHDEHPIVKACDDPVNTFKPDQES